MLVEFQKRYYVLKHSKCLMPVKSNVASLSVWKIIAHYVPRSYFRPVSFTTFLFNDPCQFTVLFNSRSLIFGVTPFGLFICNFVLFCLQSSRWHTQYGYKNSVLKDGKVNVGICGSDDKQYVASVSSEHKLFYNLHRLKTNTAYFIHYLLVIQQ
jgi:hypothetical protein